jgi:L-ascorbate metabolism protein UlaG (beta-lactamase superfamily)
MLPPVMGSMLEFSNLAGKTPLRIYIIGDTLLHDHRRKIPRHYPEIDLALLHLGGTKIMGVMLTMNGKQGVEVLKIMAPKTAIPIHYNDYNFFKSLLEDFKQAVEAAELGQLVKNLARRNLPV